MTLGVCCILESLPSTAIILSIEGAKAWTWVVHYLRSIASKTRDSVSCRPTKGSSLLIPSLRSMASRTQDSASSLSSQTRLATSLIQFIHSRASKTWILASCYHRRTKASTLVTKRYGFVARKIQTKDSALVIHSVVYSSPFDVLDIGTDFHADVEEEWYKSIQNCQSFTIEPVPVK